MTRETGTIVYPLHDSAYDVTVSDHYALGVNPHTGEAWLIHTEGVGYAVKHDKPWRFSDYSTQARWYSVKDVREFPVTEGVDLSVWIRTFGSRLESNFSMMHHALNRPSSQYVDDNAELYKLLGEFVPNIKTRETTS